MATLDTKTMTDISRRCTHQGQLPDRRTTGYELIIQIKQDGEAGLMCPRCNNRKLSVKTSIAGQS